MIEYAGRIDHQVKIRGHRIELGEIEARLQAQAQVREVIVLALDGQLVAYLVPGDPARDPHTLREVLKGELRAHLPDYMVPTHFVLLDAMPLTANGKLTARHCPLRMPPNCRRSTSRPKASWNSNWPRSGPKC